MDTEGRDREAALEARVELLEARVFRLESARDSVPSQAASAAPAATPAAATSIGWPTAPATPAAVTPALVPPAAVTPGAVPPAAAPPAVSTGWVLPAPGRSPTSGGRPRDAEAKPLVSLSWSELEARLTGRALAWVGGLAIVLGAIFFLSLAFSRGWIGAELRVVIGLAAGSAALLAGGVLMERKNRLMGHVLTPVGLAVISVSAVGATSLYELVPVPIGLAIVLLSALAASAIAVRSDSPVVAGFGLVAVLAAPPLLGASPDATTLAFVAAVLVGTTVVSLWKTWSWLPPIAFVLSAPQAASWILGEPQAAVGLVGVGLYWLLNVVAAGGEEFRRRRPDISPSSATLLLGNAAFLVWAGFELLTGELIAYRGLFLLDVALGHMVVGAYFLRRDGDLGLFGLLATGTGLAALTMAAPIQFDAPAVPIAWTAEAVALAWIAARRQHRYSAIASSVLFALAGAAVLWVHGSTVRTIGEIPFVDPPGAALAFFVAGVAVGVWLTRAGRYAPVLAAFGVLVSAACVVAQLDDLWLVTAWAALMVVGFAIGRWLVGLRAGAPVRPIVASRWAWSSDQILQISAILVGSLALAHVLAFELPLGSFGDVAPPVIPFSDAGALAAAILVAATLASGVIATGVTQRRAVRAAVVTAGAIVAYTIPFEVYAWAVAVLWAGLAIAFVAIGRYPRLADPLYAIVSLVLVGLAVVVAVGIVAPPTRLVASAIAIEPMVIAQSLAAFAAPLIAAVLLARTMPSWSMTKPVWIACGVVAVYALSVGLVGVVGLTMRDGIDDLELRTRGHVALSLLWALLGIAAFVSGLSRRVALLRQGGLVLLAITTAKVFLFDLSSLDVAYRVISLIALGMVLLAGAWLWQRSQPKPPLGDGNQGA